MLSSFRARDGAEGRRGPGSPARRRARSVLVVGPVRGPGRPGSSPPLTIWRQTQFALAEGLGAGDDKSDRQRPLPPAAAPSPTSARKLPGVAAVGCSAPRIPSTRPPSSILVKAHPGPWRAEKVSFSIQPVDFGYASRCSDSSRLAGRLLFFPRPRSGRRAERSRRRRPSPSVILNRDRRAQPSGFRRSRGRADRPPDGLGPTGSPADDHLKGPPRLSRR